MIGYLKEFNDSMTISFRTDDSKLFKKYCKIWKTIKVLLGIELDSEPVYGDTDFYIKTKVKMYDNKVNTNFQGKEILKGDSSYKCLSFIMLDSLVKVGKKYYPQVFLEECKYVKRRNKMFNYINDELQPVTKIVRLAPPRPLFNIGCTFVYLFLVLAAWHGFFRLGTTLSQGEGEILGNFNQA